MSLAEAEAKVKNVEEVIRRASKEWEAFTGGEAVQSFNSGRNLSTKELAELVGGVIKLVRGTAMVLSAEQTALKALVEAMKSGKQRN